MSSEKEEGAGAPISPDVDEDESTGYKPPAEKSLAEILSTDQDDESLARYILIAKLQELVKVGKTFVPYVGFVCYVKKHKRLGNVHKLQC